MKRTLLMTFVAVAALVGAPSAPAGDTNCVGSLTATYDNIVVPAGASCYLSGARVRGNILVRTGARLSITSRPEGSGGFGLQNPTIVDGSVQAENAEYVSIFGSEVRGNVQLKGGSEGASFFFARVRGNLQVEGMAGRLSVAITGIGGGLDVTKTSGGIEIVLGFVFGSVKLADNVVPPGDPFLLGLNVQTVQVSGDLQVQNNRGLGTKRVTGNTVGGGLQCSGNTASFVGGPNTAVKHQGQCF
jgi:hypothetical protein